MGVPWRPSGQDLALSVAQVQALVQELRPRKRCGSARSQQQQHVQVHVLLLSVKGGSRVRQRSVITTSVCGRLQYLRVLEKICEVQQTSAVQQLYFCEVFSSRRHFKMLQGFPVLEMGLKTML